MEKQKFNLNQTLTTAIIVVGAVVAVTVAFNYSGDVQLKFGADGISLQIDGGEKN